MDNQWIIKQEDFDDISTIKKNETLFTLGNGYLGMRGDLILPGKSFQSGTYINGFYEKGPICYGEKAYGYAENWQTMIGIPEGKELKIKINNKSLFSDGGRFLDNSRVLNMKDANSEWSFIWEDSNKNIISGKITTVVPFEMKGTVLFIWEINLPKDGSDIQLESKLYYNKPVKSDTDDPRISAHFNGNSIIVEKEIETGGERFLNIATTGSNLLLSCQMNHEVTGVDFNPEFENIENGYIEKWSGSGSKNITIVKSVCYSYSGKNSKESIKKSVIDGISKVKKIGYQKLLENQKLFMDQFWKRSDIKVKGSNEVQISLRFNFFHLLQSTGRDGKRSIAAKGLSGPGYEGHYFWDAETYILPFFIYTNPDIARSMLLYRISILDKARQRAQILGHKGVLFPWRTINGEESSAYFPAGTAQFHINADIALGLTKYLEVTGDTTILDDGGVELLRGTANFWCSLGSYINGKGFCFNTVTGPDEYTAMVDNNYFTNLMAKNNLLASAKWLKNISPKSELELWLTRARQVYLPIEREVTPQDDSFFNKERWDFENTDESKYPLLLNFHPLNIYRKQVLKQADVIMAGSLNRSNFPPGLLKRNFDYYEEITTRDSSLSACAQGINAFWLGYEDLSWEYFLETVHTDIKDLHDNVFHGLHTASMGGAFLMIFYGFIGLETFNNSVRFRPKLPKKLECIESNITVQGSLLNIVMEKNSIIYTALDSDIVFYHFSDEIKIKKGESITLGIDPKIKYVYNGAGIEDKLKVEELMFNEINKKGVLPEETIVVTDSEEKSEKFSSLGYLSLTKVEFEDKSKTDDMFIQYRNRIGKFRGFRPKV